MKKWTAFILALVMCLSLCACSQNHTSDRDALESIFGGTQDNDDEDEESAKTLTLPLRYVQLSTYGEPLNGNNSQVPDATITVKETLRDGDTVIFDYVGTRYRGIIRDDLITWDNNPEFLEGGTLLYTTISIDKQVVEMEFTFSYETSSGDVSSVEILQTFYE